MKKVISFMFLLALLVGVASCTSVSAADDTYVTLDINPSVELIVTPRDKVIYVSALNEDGEILLAELHLVGMNIDDAIELIINTSIELGYIEAHEEDTVVLVTAISKNQEIGETLRNRIKNHVNNSLKNHAVKGRAEDKLDNRYVPDFLLEAQSYDVSPGFLFIAKKAVFVDDALTLEAALEMEVNELQEVIMEAHNEHKEITETLREEFLAAREVLFNTYLPQIQDYNLQIAEIEAQIAVTEDEEEKATLEASLTELKLALDNLKIEFKTELETLRDSFIDQTEGLGETYREMYQYMRNHNGRPNE